MRERARARSRYTRVAVEEKTRASAGIGRKEREREGMFERRSGSCGSRWVCLGSGLETNLSGSK